MIQAKQCQPDLQQTPSVTRRLRLPRFKEATLYDDTCTVTFRAIAGYWSVSTFDADQADLEAALHSIFSEASAATFVACRDLALAIVNDNPDRDALAESLGIRVEFTQA